MIIKMKVFIWIFLFSCESFLIFNITEFNDVIRRTLSHLDEFHHSALWYICENGFTETLKTLINESFGITKIVIEELRNSLEDSRPLWIAVHNGQLEMVEMLTKEPFSLISELEETSAGISPKTLASFDLKPGMSAILGPKDPDYEKVCIWFICNS